MTLDDLKKFSPVELDFLSENIYKLVNENVSTKTQNNDNYNYKAEYCPHCKKQRIIKYGFDKGKQKYYCKDCSKYFLNTTGTVYQRSRGQYLLWKKFISCEINGLTLLQTSAAINKSKTTCFYMRHKLYKAIEKLTSNHVLQGLVELDTSFIKINLKGTKPQNMPRKSKKRGNTSAYSGISHHKICIVTAIDESDNIIFKIAGLGQESTDKYLQFKDCFESTCKIISDSSSPVKKFAEKIGVSLEQIPIVPNKKRYTTKSGNTISNVNQLHQELSILISKKRGISTKHLQDYLNWLVFTKKIKYKIRAQALSSHTYMQVMSQLNYISNKKICSLPMPINLKHAYGEYKYGIFADPPTL